MMRNHEPAEPEAAIDMAPLIDIVFILLIFFMVTTTFVKDMKLDLERPKASSKVILVVTDEGVPAGKLVEVIDQARLSGAESVGVATKKEAG